MKNTTKNTNAVRVNAKNTLAKVDKNKAKNTNAPRLEYQNKLLTPLASIDRDAKRELKNLLDILANANFNALKLDKSESKLIITSEEKSKITNVIIDNKMLTIKADEVTHRGLKQALISSTSFKQVVDVRGKTKRDGLAISLASFLKSLQSFVFKNTNRH